MKRYTKLALVGVLALGASCSSFTWSGKKGNVDAEAAAKGVESVATLERKYDTERYWAFWRQDLDNHLAAIGRGLNNIHRSIDRHVFLMDFDDGSGR